MNEVVEAKIKLHSKHSRSTPLDIGSHSHLSKEPLRKNWHSFQTVAAHCHSQSTAKERDGHRVLSMMRIVNLRIGSQLQTATGSRHANTQ